jgi:hypothetical protein
MVRERWVYLLLTFLILAFFLYPLTILEVRDDRAGEVIIRSKVSPGDQFEFRYIHSVEKVPVIGSFIITPERMIKPIETRFPSYGPGLPFAGDEVKLEKDGMKATPKVEAMKTFSFFVSPSTHQSFIFKDASVDFSSLKEGRVITIEVKSCPMGGVLFGYRK